MAWHAKPSGGYSYTSTECRENWTQIYNTLSSSWSIEAVCGAIGNMAGESGWNPWRWQGDRVNYNLGYGLVQFTPASGYINDYGVGVSGYAPNLSTTGQTSGASPSDGQAQCLVLKTDRAHKWINRQRYCSWMDLSSCATLSGYEAVTDLYLATAAFMFNYEGNDTVLHGSASAQRSMVDNRYFYTQKAYEYLTGVVPPTPPTPPTPVPPQPHKKMPLSLMLRSPALL